MVLDFVSTDLLYNLVATAPVACLLPGSGPVDAAAPRLLLRLALACTHAHKLLFRMDSVSPSSNLSAVSSSASSSVPDARRQPTYTTVGSVYNPSSAMPLQPPTRRPRSRRFQQPIRNGIPIFPFPDDLLSALPIEDNIGDAPPTAATTIPQYAPLQQNYDRAATPVTEPENFVLPSNGLPAPSTRSGNTPFSAECEDSDNIGSEDTLASSRITVKGLTNLASYPNPMQKAAQSRLAGARTANLGLSRPNTPLSLSSAALDPGKDRPASAYGTGASVAGPQPLTAGPPGQRQLKPAPLEVVSRSLRLDEQAATLSPMASVFQSRLSDGPVYPAHSGLLPAFEYQDNAVDTEQSIQLSSNERYHNLGSQVPSDPSGSRPPSAPVVFNIPTEALSETTRKIQDTLPFERIRKYYPIGPPPDYDGRYRPIAENWHTKYPILEDRSLPELSAERRRRVDRSFYSGTKGLVKNIEQVVRDHNYRCLENKVGVIGGERERLRESHIERSGCDGKIQLPRLSVEEVNEMDEGEVAKPLLNMAFGTLLRCKDESESGASSSNAGPSGFTEAQFAWVDNTEEGNASFFSELKEEPLRRRIPIPRKPRRGY